MKELNIELLNDLLNFYNIELSDLKEDMYSLEGGSKILYNGIIELKNKISNVEDVIDWLENDFTNDEMC